VFSGFLRVGPARALIPFGLSLSKPEHLGWNRPSTGSGRTEAKHRPPGSDGWNPSGLRL